MTAHAQLEALLAQTRWLGGLARHLVRNDHDAADLVQETLRVAVERPPADGPPLRGWLGTVLHSRWRDWLRQQRARGARELAVAAARGEAPDTADVVQKAEAQRLLVEAVLALDEPYRTCVLLRFFENLPPRVIARRTRAPIATVHSRLQRALAQLRARLLAKEGRPWRSAVAPLLMRGPFVSLLLGVPLVHATTKVALAAAVVALASLYWLWPAAPALSQTSEAASPRSSPTVGPGGTPDPVAASSQRVEVTPPAASAPAGAIAAPHSVRGRVLDVRGVGVPGVRLQLGRGEERTMPEGFASEPDGAFEIAAPRPGTTVASGDARWSTVLEGLVRADQPCTVVVAPRLDLAGRVVDGGGAPVLGAAVSAHMPAQLGADLGVLLDFSTPRKWRSAADADGRFRLADVPAVASASLFAELGGWLPRIVPLPAASTELLELVLERPGSAASVVDGLVVDRWGTGVAGARVSAGAAVARSDARGAFTLDVSGPELASQLVAVAAGMQPAVFTPERDAKGQARWPRRVVLELGMAPLALSGRVMFADGRPCKGARVWIADPTFVGVEGDAVLAENVLRGEGRPFWAFTTTGDDGTFRLEGLGNRAYTLRAVDLRTLLEVTQAGVLAGRGDVELRLTGATFPQLRVRVATRDGAPVAKVHVRLQRPALEVQVPGGTRDEWANGQSGHTDERGAFTFTDVPVSGVELFTFGDTIMFAGKTIEPGIDPTDFVLTVDRRMHLQVEVAPPVDRADQCRVLDADGKPMLLRIMRGNAAQTNRTADVTEGKSHILSLGEGARTVVFLRGGREVGRLPVQLAAGQVTTVRF